MIKSELLFSGLGLIFGHCVLLWYQKRPLPRTPTFLCTARGLLWEKISWEKEEHNSWLRHPTVTKTTILKRTEKNQSIDTNHEWLWPNSYSTHSLKQGDLFWSLIWLWIVMLGILQYFKLHWIKTFLNLSYLNSNKNPFEIATRTKRVKFLNIPYFGQFSNCVKFLNIV